MTVNHRYADNRLIRLSTGITNHPTIGLFCPAGKSDFMMYSNITMTTALEAKR